MKIARDPSGAAPRRRWSALFAAALALTLAGPTTGPATAAGDIVIGATLPLTGPLAGFGSFQQWGYQHAVDEVNAGGGITVDGVKQKVKLVIRDDKTDPNAASGNIETLSSRDGAVALLGSCTPVLVNAAALIAERHKIPMVTGCDPLEAFTGVRSWTYVWDIFFSGAELAITPLKMLADAGVKSNKKVAILHDNGPDGQQVGGLLWPQFAKQFGYTVVTNASFPLDNTQFTSIIAQAKAAGADIVLVDAVTPQAVSIRKQLVESGLSPVLLVIEKGGEPVQFATALGKLADGVIVGAYWDPSLPYPGAATLEKQFEKDTGKSGSQHIADSYTAAKVLLDAIAAAASTDPAKVNAAIGHTNKTYVVGPIKFGPDHTAKLAIVEGQWQAGKTVIVWPHVRATGKLLTPLPK
jgi:branched-chain amino acid transport system substrate-binding protein